MLQLCFFRLKLGEFGGKSGTVQPGQHGVDSRVDTFFDSAAARDKLLKLFPGAALKLPAFLAQDGDKVLNIGGLAQQLTHGIHHARLKIINADRHAAALARALLGRAGIVIILTL